MRHVFVVLVAVLLLVVCASACCAKNVPSSAAHQQENYLRAIRWAERTLHETSPLPTEDQDEVGESLEEVEGNFQQVIRKYGSSVRAQIGLGRCRMAEGNYPKAVLAFQKAVAMAPADRDARAGLAKAAASCRIAPLICQQLDHGQSLQDLVPISDGRQARAWLALSAKPAFEAEKDLADVRLTLFWETTHGLRKTWCSPHLHDPRFTPDDFMDVRLSVLDVTRDSVPEAVVSEMSLGGSWEPSHMDIFALSGRKMVPLFGGVSNIPVRLTDFRQDGHLQIVCTYEIGEDMCHAEQPRWIDVYALRNSHFRLADAAFPQAYYALGQEIRQKLRRYPDDLQLHEYLARIDEIERHPTDACTQYRFVQRRCYVRLKDEANPEIRAELQRGIQRVQIRSAALRRLTHFSLRS